MPPMAPLTFDEPSPVIVSAGAKLLSIPVFAWVYEHRVAELGRPDVWWSWIVLLFGEDCCYYWFHRMSHEVNAFWAAHVVHHQSEEYNLAVALRQGAFQSAFSWLFYLPLALLGFPPLVFLAVSSIDFQHSAELIERSGLSGLFEVASLSSPGALEGLGTVSLAIAECGACYQGGIATPLRGARRLPPWGKVTQT